MKTLARSLLICMAAHCTFARADCANDAANAHGVNPWILRAIAYQGSSYRPHLVTRNKGGSVDVGFMGINRVHFAELRAVRIDPTRRQDTCVALQAGAYLPRKHMQRLAIHGTTRAPITANRRRGASPTQRASSKSWAAGSRRV